MAVRKILQLGDPALREKAAGYDFGRDRVDLPGLVQDLGDTLAHWRRETGYGRGIAAPQIGVPKRVIFLKLPGDAPWLLVNPEILLPSEEKILVWDACLSFLSIFMQVERHKEITVRYQDLGGQSKEVRAGLAKDLSELLQHEIDHLDGILCIDRVKDLRSLCTKEEFEKRYRAQSPYATGSKEAAQ
jgi:peptide deformylase